MFGVTNQVASAARKRYGCAFTPAVAGGQATVLFRRQPPRRQPPF